MTKPIAAPTSKPPTVSSSRSGGMTNSALRSDAPANDATVWTTSAPTMAPTSPASGVYGELEPSWRRCGASRAPTTAPAARPASERAVAISPRRSPPNADTAAMPSAIQSTRVTVAR